MNLSSCLSTSDRRLRSWKMVMLFLRISTWEWYKLESSKKKKWTRGTSLYIPPLFSSHRPQYLSLHDRNQGMRKICNAPSSYRLRLSSFFEAERCQFDPFIAPKFLTRLSTMQATTVWMPETEKKRERRTLIPDAPNEYEKIYHHKIAVLKLLLKLDSIR